MNCDLHASGAIDLYFYGELDAAGHASVEDHLRDCAECRGALEELSLIRTALASRPAVSEPPDGWTAFMSRLDGEIGRLPEVAHALRFVPLRRRSHVAPIAMAALVALVTLSVLFVARARRVAPVSETHNGAVMNSAPGEAHTADPGFAALSEEHFERSKLVLLGLATKDPRHTTPADWIYERELASSLLSDTRMYRLAAEDRGMDQLAGVMGDLELVLLQASLTSDPDPAALAQIQRLIRKRDLLQKINAVSVRGI
jgi:hypothetical protein